MPFARKLILRAPVSDETLLNDFVEQCLVDGVSLVAVVGPGCERVEDLIDDIIVGDGTDATRFLSTTSHPDEPYEIVFAFVQSWEIAQGDRVEEIQL
jgi:hypothetical protein